MAANAQKVGAFAVDNDFEFRVSSFPTFQGHHALLGPITQLLAPKLGSLQEALDSIPNDDIAAEVRALHAATALSSVCLLPTSEYGLNYEEAAALFLYTCPEFPLASLLKARLGTQDRRRLSPYVPYLALLQAALSKLPSAPIQTLWSAARGDLASALGPLATRQPFGTITVWDLPSATLHRADVDAIFHKANADSSGGPYSIVSIRSTSARDITAFSASPAVDKVDALCTELLFASGTVFRVCSVQKVDPQCSLVELEEHENVYTRASRLRVEPLPSPSRPPRQSASQPVIQSPQQQQQSQASLGSQPLFEQTQPQPPYEQSQSQPQRMTRSSSRHESESESQRESQHTSPARPASSLALQSQSQFLPASPAEEPMSQPQSPAPRASGASPSSPARSRSPSPSPPSTVSHPKPTSTLPIASPSSSQPASPRPARSRSKTPPAPRPHHTSQSHPKLQQRPRPKPKALARDPHLPAKVPPAAQPTTAAMVVDLSDGDTSDTSSPKPPSPRHTRTSARRSSVQQPPHAGRATAKRAAPAPGDETDSTDASDSKRMHTQAVSLPTQSPAASPSPSRSPQADDSLPAAAPRSPVSGKGPPAKRRRRTTESPAALRNQTQADEPDADADDADSDDKPFRAARHQPSQRIRASQASRQRGGEPMAPPSDSGSETAPSSMQTQGIKAALAGLHESVTRAPSVANALAAADKLLAISLKRTGIAALAAADGPKTLLAAMTRFLDETKVLHVCLQLLVRLSRRAECSKRIVQLDGAETVVKIMLRHIHDLGIQTYGCRLFARIVEGNEVQLVDAGAIDSMTHAMKIHPQQASIAEEGCRFFYAVLAVVEQHRELLSEVKERHGVAAILSALHRHAADVAVQDSGCWALASLAAAETLVADEQDVSKMLPPDLCTKMAQAAIKAVIAHLSDALLQEAGLSALLNTLVVGSITEKSLVERALSAVVQCLNTHKNTELGQLGIRLLTKLMKESQLSPQAISTAGRACMKAVVKTMRDHPAAAAIQAKGAEALWTVAFRGDEDPTLAKIAVHDGLKHVLAAMCNPDFSSNAELQGDCCEALSNLAYYDQTQVLIVEAGGITAVVAAMEAHPTSSRVQATGCQALCNFAVHDSNLPLLERHDFIELVATAMRAFPDDAEVQTHACAFLLNLDSIAYAAHPGLGGLEDTLAALGRHPDIREVQQFWCTKLWEAVRPRQSAAVVRRAVARGAPQLVEAAMAAFADWQTMQDICQQLLDKMASAS